MIERLKNIFVEVVGVEEKDLENGLLRSETEQWNSITHFDLVVAIEDEFEIEFSREEILQFDSFDKAVEVLKNHQVEE